jgi:hypothetical protein
VSWPTARKALVAAAARWLTEPTPTTRLAIDETQAQAFRTKVEIVVIDPSARYIGKVRCARLSVSIDAFQAIRAQKAEWTFHASNFSHVGS